MDEWLKQNWFFGGSAVLCGIGLAFALGAVAETGLTTAKRWWIALWMGLFGFYFFGLIFPTLRIHNPLALIIPALFNGISTLAIAGLWLWFRDHRPISIRGFTIISFVAALSAAMLVCASYARNPVVGLFPELLSWIFFLLFAWTQRSRHMATTILLLAYANLQLPAGLFGKQGWGVDPLALLAAKLSLIAAMYNTLGIRDRPAPAFEQVVGPERR
jgi:hypothetical protein